MAHSPNSLDAQLLDAAQASNAPEALRLLQLGANPRAAREDNGFTALMLAAGAGCEELAAALVGLGAPAQTNHFLRALDVAAREGRAGCVRLLLPVSNPDRRVSREGSALHLAARSGDAECVRLLATRQRAKARDDIGNTPLMIAASSSTQAFEALLPFSSLSAVNAFGATALSLLSYPAISRHENDAARAGPWRALHERVWGMAKASEQKTALKALLAQSRWEQLLLAAELSTPEQLALLAQWAKKDAARFAAPPSFSAKLARLAQRSEAMSQARELGEAIRQAGEPAADACAPAASPVAKRRL